jgi:hypothetical protein
MNILIFTLTYSLCIPTYTQVMISMLTTSYQQTKPNSASRNILLSASNYPIVGKRNDHGNITRSRTNTPLPVRLSAREAPSNKTGSPYPGHSTAHGAPHLQTQPPTLYHTSPKTLSAHKRPLTVFAFTGHPISPAASDTASAAGTRIVFPARPCHPTRD